MFFKSYYAGIAIGLGCWLYLSIENPMLAALLFSCGLLAVRVYGLNLFTGKTQQAWRGEWATLPHILIGNLLGICTVVLVSGLIGTEKVSTIARAKAAQPFLLAIAKGIGCGMLMSFATCKQSPLWISGLCVLAFILAGFNHCIADFFYLLAGKCFTINWFGTLVGNICGGLVFTNLNPLISDDIKEITW